MRKKNLTDATVQTVKEKKSHEIKITILFYFLSGYLCVFDVHFWIYSHL